MCEQILKKYSHVLLLNIKFKD